MDPGRLGVGARRVALSPVARDDAQAACQPLHERDGDEVRLASGVRGRAQGERDETSAAHRDRVRARERASDGAHLATGWLA